MSAEKPTQLPTDPKAERKEERDAAKEQRKSERDRLRVDPENTTVDENTGEVLPADELSSEDAEEQAALAVDEHPYGRLGGDLQLEDLPEPKPKVDLFPNHSPVGVPVKIQEIVDAGQKRVEARLDQLNEEREQRKQSREEARASAKDRAEARKEARIEDREERKAEAHRPTQLPAKEPVNK